MITNVVAILIGIAAAIVIFIIVVVLALQGSTPSPAPTILDNPVGTSCYIYNGMTIAEAVAADIPNNCIPDSHTQGQ
jgi:hypothetical protein